MCSHPIQFLFVSLNEADRSKICLIWLCDHVSLPPCVHCELCNRFVASQLVRVELHETVASLLHILGMTKHQVDLCSTCDSLVKVASMYRKCNIQCLLPNIASNLGIVL